MRCAYPCGLRLQNTLHRLRQMPARKYTADSAREKLFALVSVSGLGNGRAVYVTINATTKRQITMPNLQDISYRQAETTLRGLGLRVDSTYDYEPSAFRDLDLDVKSNGVSIAPGSKIPIGTRVRLVVGFGRGTEMVSVPSVLGMTLQEARSLLLNHRLTVGAVNYDEETEEGVPQYVYSQSPRPGEQLLEGETVALHLSKDIEKAANSNNFQEKEEDTWF